MKDDSRSGCPINEETDEILEKVQQDGHISSIDIGMELGIDHKIVLNHLRKASYKRNLPMELVSHELSVNNMIDRNNICDALLQHNEIEPFLKRFYNR